jgi:hypothetical protein
MPAEQTMPDGQACPHPPQFAGSRIVSTHSPPQAVSPAGQLVTHAPDKQA